MANGRPFYQWQFDCDDDDYGFDVTANDDVPVDFESLFNTIADKSRGDHSEVIFCWLHCDWFEIWMINL